MEIHGDGSAWRCIKRHEGEWKQCMEIEMHGDAGASAWSCIEVHGGA